MDLTIQTTIDLYKDAHQRMREAIAGLEPADISWTPAPNANSISVLIVHTLGSEAEVLRVVRGLPSDRDRDAEFVDQPATVSDLLVRLDAADALLAEHAAAITADDLLAMRDRPNRAPQLGVAWLLSNYGHEREHLAHIELTKQLLQEQRVDTTAG